MTPGMKIKELMKLKVGGCGWKVADLAMVVAPEIKASSLSSLLNGNRKLKARDALILEQVFPEVSAIEWLTIQTSYDFAQMPDDPEHIAAIKARAEMVTNGDDVKERELQRLVLDWLSAKKIWHIRHNTGAMGGTHKGKRWFVRFGKPGMADIIIAYRVREEFRTAWVELKAAKGVQSDAQKEFQKEVEQNGMQYILARSLEDLQAVLEAQ